MWIQTTIEVPSTKDRNGSLPAMVAQETFLVFGSEHASDPHMPFLVPSKSPSGSCIGDKKPGLDCFLDSCHTLRFLERG